MYSVGSREWSDPPLPWVRVWDVSTGLCLFTLLGHDNWVRGTSLPSYRFTFYFAVSQNLHLHHVSKIKSHKKPQNSRNNGFSYYFCLMMKDPVAGSRSVRRTIGSVSGGSKTYGSGSATLLFSIYRLGSGLGSGSGSASKKRKSYPDRHQHDADPQQWYFLYLGFSSFGLWIFADSCTIFT